MDCVWFAVNINNEIPWSFVKALVPHPSFSFGIGFPPCFPIGDTQFPLSCHLYAAIISQAHPTPPVPLYFPGSCSYSMFDTHIWRFGARNCRWERTCRLCISGFGNAPHKSHRLTNPKYQAVETAFQMGGQGSLNDSKDNIDQQCSFQWLLKGWGCVPIA